MRAVVLPGFGSIQISYQVPVLGPVQVALRHWAKRNEGVGMSYFKSARRFLLVAIAMFAVALFPGAQRVAFGQSSGSTLRASRASNNLGSTLRRTIQTGGLFTRAATGGSAGTSRLGFANSSAGARGVPGGGRRTGLGNGVYFQGTLNQNSSRRGTLLRYFGFSPSARFFSRAGFVGIEYSPPIRRPQFGVGSADEIIYSTQALTFWNAYHHRSFEALQESALRDAESNASLENLPEVPENIIEVTAGKQTHVERLRARIKALRQEQLDGAWEALKAGSYYQSRVAFERTSLGEEEAIPSAIGELISAVADRQTRSAVVHLKIMMQHRSKMFSHRYAFDEILPSVSEGDRIVSEIAAMVTANPDSENIAALQAFFLWIDSGSRVKQTAAINAATRLKERFRTSQYAEFLDLMQAELESEKEPPATTSPSTG